MTMQLSFPLVLHLATGKSLARSHPQTMPMTILCSASADRIAVRLNPWIFSARAVLHRCNYSYSLQDQGKVTVQLMPFPSRLICSIPESAQQVFLTNPPCTTLAYFCFGTLLGRVINKDGLRVSDAVELVTLHLPSNPVNVYSASSVMDLRGYICLRDMDTRWFNTEGAYSMVLSHPRISSYLWERWPN